MAKPVYEKAVQIRLSASVYEACERVAAAEYQPIAALLRRIISQKVEELLFVLEQKEKRDALLRTQNGLDDPPK
jgi:Iap family predicted aminopeptidase